MWSVVLCVVGVGVFPVTFSDLHVLPVKCGTLDCGKWEYCSEYETKCKPCANICNDTIHNFDATVCKRDCQDYLHDKRYLRIDAGGVDGNLKDALQRNERLVVVNQILIAILFIIVIAAGAFTFWKWKKDNNFTLAALKEKVLGKKSDNNANTTDGNVGSNVSSEVKPDLRIVMPQPGTISETMNSPATISTSISRRPAEDNALDYAYDNPAMSTPSLNSRPHESSF